MAETIKQIHANLDQIIASTKMVFMKSGKCIQAFRQAYSKTLEPPRPILYKHFEIIKSEILILDTQFLLKAISSKLIVTKLGKIWLLFGKTIKLNTIDCCPLPFGV